MSLISKLCVLKRYAPKDKKLKIKKPKADSSSNLRLVISDQAGIRDDSASALGSINIDSDIDDEFGEDSPIIAEIIDERAEHLKLADDLLDSRKWKSIESPVCVDSKNKFADIEQDINAGLGSCQRPGRLKLEIGGRLSKSKLKAAAMATQYCRLMSQNTSSHQRNAKIDTGSPVTSWRNIEAIPVSTAPVERADKSRPPVEDRQTAGSDSDSDISVDRAPQESARSTYRSEAAPSRSVGSTLRTEFRSQMGTCEPPRTADATSGHTQTAEMNTNEERANKCKLWSRGIAQMRDSALHSQQLEASKDQPLARYKDDVELDGFLRKRKREGDPMAQFLESSQGVPSEDKPAARQTCRHLATPNRFNIQPGCRWDGVDRSSGFELKLINAKAGKLSIAEHAYKWKVEDM